MSKQLTIDTNLLVLLIVGLTSTAFIERHKRTRIYTKEDFELLSEMLSGVSSLVVTPHVLSETSNLLRQYSEPGKSLISAVMQRLIDTSIETFVPSSVAASRAEYFRLGLTDAAMIELQSSGIALLTDDLDLYVASVTAGFEAINFSHARDARLSR